MPKTKEDILNEVEAALEEVRGPLSRHEGGIEAVDFDIGTGALSVRFKGMCDGCPFADQTLHTIIEEAVMSSVPEVRDVTSV